MVIPTLHALQMRPNVVLLAYAFFRFLQEDLVVAGIGLHPSPIFVGSLGQNLRSDRVLSLYVTEEIHNVFGPGEQGQCDGLLFDSVPERQFRPPFELGVSALA